MDPFQVPLTPQCIYREHYLVEYQTDMHQPSHHCKNKETCENRACGEEDKAENQTFTLDLKLRKENFVLVDIRK